MRVGETRPLESRDPFPALFPVPCSVFRVSSVAPCLRLTMSHCLHAPRQVCVRGLELMCAAAACLVRWNHNKPLREDTAARPRRFLRRACLSPMPTPCHLVHPCLCEWGCACPVSGVGWGLGRGRWPLLCVSCTSECPVSAVAALTTHPPPFCACPALAPGPPGCWGPVCRVTPRLLAASCSVLFKSAAQGQKPRKGWGKSRPDPGEMGRR